MPLLPRRVKRVQPLLGTFVEITLDASLPEPRLQKWITQAFQGIDQVDRLMSRYRPESDVGRINRSEARHWVKVHPMTASVLYRADRLYQKSGGRFDIRQKLPRSLAAGSARSVRLFDRRGSFVRKLGSWRIDLGGIAKGFAVDQAVTFLQRAGGRRLSGGIVNAGGDLRLWGRSQHLATSISAPGKVWTHFWTGQNLAVATSSVRQPQTPRLTPVVLLRMPGGTPLARARTVSVLAERCIIADAMTKIVLTAPRLIARKMLLSHGACALIYGPRGQLTKVIG